MNIPEPQAEPEEWVVASMDLPDTIRSGDPVIIPPGWEPFTVVILGTVPVVLLRRLREVTPSSP